MKLVSIAFMVAVISIVGCSSSNVVTQEQMALENKVDSAINDILFKNDMEALASYSIHKNGKVNIKFAESVKYRQYKKVVDELRAHPDIPGVRAEQAGMEVCTQKVDINTVLENNK